MRTIKGLKAYVACTCLALFCGTAEAKWYEVQTQDFRIVSAIDKKRTAGIARDIEVWQASVAKVMPRVDMHPHVPVTILLLPRTQFQKYSGLPSTVGGAARPFPTADFIIANADTWEKTSVIVFHELAHLVLHANSQDAALPVWYDEGFADVLSTVQAITDKQQAKVGVPPPERLGSVLELPWMPLKDVLAMERSNPNYTSERMGPVFYGESWLLVHYSIFGNPARGKQLNQYRVLLDNGVKPDVAFATAFPDDHGELEKEMMTYRHSHSWSLAIVGPVVAPPFQLDRVKEISDVEGVNALGAWILAPSRQLTPLQTELLTDNAKGQPAQSVAALQFALAQVLSGKAALAQPAIESGCSAPIAALRAAILCGDLYGIQAEKLSEKTEHRRELATELFGKAQPFYLRAVEIDPSNTEALTCAAYTFNYRPGDSAPIRAGLEKAFERDHGNPLLAQSIALLYRESDLQKTKFYLERSLANTIDFESAKDVLEELRDVEDAIATANNSRPVESSASAAASAAATPTKQ